MRKIFWVIAVFSIFFISLAFPQTPEEIKLPEKFSKIPKVSGEIIIDGDLKIGFGRCINDYDKGGEVGVSSGGAWQDTSKMNDVVLAGSISVESLMKLATSWSYLKHK